MSARTVGLIALLVVALGACGGRGRGRGRGGSPDGGGPGPDSSTTTCTTNNDCLAAAGPCGTSVCDTAASRCVVGSAAPDGTACDDGDQCTSFDACMAGTCGGTMMDCSAFGSACAVGVCDSSTGLCGTMPSGEGAPCDDGDACTAGDSCMGGVCVPGAAPDCSGLTDTCHIGECDRFGAGCVARERPNGTPCNDGDLCTTRDACSFGTCSGAAVDCSAMATDCNLAACDPASGRCLGTPRPDGWACDDSDACTRVDRCAAGACVGSSPLDCSGSADQCNSSRCDPVTGCVAVPYTDGRACNDMDACTPVDTCTAGICGGTSTCCNPRDFRVVEYNGSGSDFIEIQNRGSCTLNANTVSIRFRGSCDSTSRSFTFPSRMIPPGGIIRAIETSAVRADEVYLGRTFCHGSNGNGWVALCEGTCNLTTCGNFVDYMEQNTSTVRPPGYPTCTTFTPSPVRATGATSSQSINRIAFAGSGRAGRQSDWAIRTFTR